MVSEFYKPFDDGVAVEVLKGVVEIRGLGNRMPLKQYLKNKKLEQQGLRQDVNDMRWTITKTIKRHIGRNPCLHDLPFVIACRQLSWHLGYKGDNALRHLPLGLGVATQKSDVSILSHYIRAYLASIARIEITALIPKDESPVIGNIVTIGTTKEQINLGKAELFKAMLSLMDENEKTLLNATKPDPLDGIYTELHFLHNEIKQIKGLLLNLKNGGI